MTDRIIDISEGTTFLKIENSLLKLIRDKKEIGSIPLAEVAVLVLSTPSITLTHPVLSELSSAGAIVVCSDSKRLPTGMMLPLDANSIQAERFNQQAHASKPTVKRLWQQLITAKVKNQGLLLHSLYGEDMGLSAMSKNVKTGDSDNIEAQAARRYWQRMEFLGVRDQNGNGPNAFLNYGYAVLMAMTARAICSSGLHPGLGVHHHNRYNPYCLASDLMEPLRPLVDYAVAEWFTKNPQLFELDKLSKRHLISALLGNVLISGEYTKLFYALSRMTASLAQTFSGNQEKLLLPEPIFNNAV